jgi:hypothetical protein
LAAATSSEREDVESAKAPLLFFYEPITYFRAAENAIFTTRPVSALLLSSQLVQQRLGFFQIREVEPFSEPMRRGGFSTGMFPRGQAYDNLSELAARTRQQGDR